MKGRSLTWLHMQCGSGTQSCGWKESQQGQSGILALEPGLLQVHQQLCDRVQQKEFATTYIGKQRSSLDDRGSND